MSDSRSDSMPASASDPLPGTRPDSQPAPQPRPRLFAMPAMREHYRKKRDELSRKNLTLLPELDAQTREALWQRGFMADVSPFYDFGRYGYEAYVSCLQREMTPFINGAAGVFLRDKLVFHKTYQDRLPIPELLAIAHPWRGDSFSESWHALLHGTELRPVYCKPTLTGGGLGVFKIYLGQGRIRLKGESLDVESFFRRLHKLAARMYPGVYLLTRGLDQHPLLSGFWPETVNTLRLLCLREPRSDRRHAFSACLRVGTRRSGELDNYSQGGTLWAVDLDSGLIGSGFGRGPDGKWQSIERHPDSGRQVRGERLPHWERAVALCLAAMKQVDIMAYAGWDLVFGPEGPALIEGNDYPQLILNQMFEPLLLKPQVRHFYEFYGILDIKGPGHSV